MNGRVGRMWGTWQRIGLCLAALLAWCGLASAQHWTPITMPFPGSAGTAMLRTDGMVMVEDNSTGFWWGLVPDSTGSYQNGVWVLLPLPPVGYDPLNFASAVLPDSRIIIEGGEYNSGVKDDTKLGAIFSDSSGFTSVSAPSGWSKIGDAPSVVLPNGKFMMGDCCGASEAILNASTLTWTSTGTGKADANSEEGWTLLPNGDVLTVDTQNGTNSELYNYKTGKWTSAGNLPKFLGNSCGMGIVPEMGPAVLRPNGTVFQAGANGGTAVYNLSTKKWTAGPSFPKGYGVADGPAAILPDGNVLVMASNISPCFKPPAKFYEFNGSTLTAAPNPPNASVDSSYYGRMLVLPLGGHVLFTDGSSDVEVYIPKGSAKSSWLPTITSFPPLVTRGKSYVVKGTQFNGLSGGAAYGDDAQSATNFPLVRLTNVVTGSVYYALTKNFSTGVATGATAVQTTFVAPSSMDIGLTTLEVVANGLSSAIATINVN